MNDISLLLLIHHNSKVKDYIQITNRHLFQSRIERANQFCTKSLSNITSACSSNLVFQSIFRKCSSLVNCIELQIFAEPPQRIYIHELQFK